MVLALPEAIQSTKGTIKNNIKIPVGEDDK